MGLAGKGLFRWRTGIGCARVKVGPGCCERDWLCEAEGLVRTQVSGGRAAVRGGHRLSL